MSFCFCWCVFVMVLFLSVFVSCLFVLVSCVFMVCQCSFLVVLCVFVLVLCLKLVCLVPLSGYFVFPCNSFVSLCGWFFFVPLCGCFLPPCSHFVSVWVFSWGLIIHPWLTARGECESVSLIPHRRHTHMKSYAELRAGLQLSPWLLALLAR